MNTSSPLTGNEYDPLKPEAFETSYDDFRELRAKCPVAHSNAFDGFWAVTRYEDVMAMLLDSENYITSVRNVVPGSSTTGRRPPLHLDVPEHTPYRRAIDRAISAARVVGLEEPTRRIASRLVATLVAKREVDFVEEFSSPLPAYVFAEWMGLDARQTDILWRTARAYVKAWEAFDKESVQKAGAELAALAAELVELRSASPLDPNVDPTSSLLAERDAGGNPFPANLLAGCVRQVLVVGLVAPPIFLGSVMVHLSRDRALQRRLREDRALIPAALEEFLRLFTPYRGFARSSRREVHIHGKTIRPGEAIALVYASANRDESVFPEPDKFILNRANIRDHIAFGRGPHMCAGAPLARQQLRIALDEILRQTSDFEVCGKVRMSQMPELGPISVPLRMSPA